MFVEGAVSAIGLFDVIEHVVDDLNFLRQCRKVLAAGGLLYLTVPALQSLWSTDDEFAGHRRRYTRHSLTQLLMASGFELVVLSAFFSLLVPLVFLFRTVPSAFGSRKVEDVDKALKHHRSEHRIGVLMERILGFERALVARGATLPSEPASWRSRANQTIDRDRNRYCHRGRGNSLVVCHSSTATRARSKKSSSVGQLHCLSDRSIRRSLHSVRRMFFQDQDTFWHIRTGQWILDNANIPIVDTFSHTAHGRPWIAKVSSTTRRQWPILNAVAKITSASQSIGV